MQLSIRVLLMAPIVSSALLFAGVALSASPDVDHCDKQLPSDLRSRLNHAYPGYRAPRSADNLAEDISTNLTNGGTGCLGAAEGGFQGSGRKAIVVALTALRGDGYIIVVAARDGESWGILELLRDSDGRQRLYIDPTPAARYDHVESYEPDTAKGELASLDCPHPGVVIGATEATGDVYCIARGRWQHLPIID
jgi:hypothetical protein